MADGSRNKKGTWKKDARLLKEGSHLSNMLYSNLNQH